MSTDGRETGDEGGARGGGGLVWKREIREINFNFDSGEQSDTTHTCVCASSRSIRRGREEAARSLDVLYRPTGSLWFSPRGVSYTRTCQNL